MSALISEADERAAFERWFRESQGWPPNYPLPTRVGREQRYELGFMQHQWLGWLARSFQVQKWDCQCMEPTCVYCRGKGAPVSQELEPLYEGPRDEFLDGG